MHYPGRSRDTAEREVGSEQVNRFHGLPTPSGHFRPYTDADAIMVVYSLLIINKAGGLVYNRIFNAGLTALSLNDSLVLAGTFHGVHAISRQLAPSTPVRDSTGIETLQTTRFLLSCHQTPTGTKFLLFSEPAQQNAEVIIKRCYELYADYVMKNPFYSLEMPIRCEKFEKAVQAWVGVK